MSLSLVTLVDLLRRCATEPPREAFRFLDDGTALDTHALVRRARAIATRLSAGARVLLLYPAGLDAICGLFGCIAAGAIAIPAEAPQPMRASRARPRLRAIIDDARPTCALTTSTLAPAVREALGDAPVAVIATETLDGDEAPLADARPGDVAYLQYTSGSTAEPRGVMVTHRNALANCAYVTHGGRYTADSVALSWVPSFHDMGLVMGILQPITARFPSLLLSPLAFLQSPRSWLEHIGWHGVTHSGGPNFAYDLCVRRVRPEERAGLDLSRWSLAYTSAEPVRKDTIDRFVAAFGPCGFQASAFYPAYGLAEATLKVTGGPRDRGATVLTVDAAALARHEVAPSGAGVPLVASGEPYLDTRVEIVDEHGARCAPDHVGEIWVRSPAVAAGYLGRPDETELTFRARLDGENETYLRTGDLGFLSGGQLFVTGRIKDLIIVHGKNHYPQDLEATAARSHASIRPGGCAAFAVTVDAEERVVLVAEIAEGAGHDEVVRAVRQAIAEVHEIKLENVLTIAPGALPKTSSGKLRRQETRAAYLAGRFS
jgi:acyl-CoA synthetase (AMP-forming)/AMP-acid ligase II